MGQIIKFDDRVHQIRARRQPATVTKTIDGEIVECIDFDMLSPQEAARILTANSLQSK